MTGIDGKRIIGRTSSTEEASMSAIVPDPAVASYGIAVSAAIDFGAATTTPVEAGEVEAG